LDLRQIQYFVCLYEEGSVTRAARRLNVVQPALSMQIGRLEKRLGVDLFERTARGMIPTSAGEAMYRLYLPVLLDLKHANQRMMELSGKVLGKIAVGIIPSITNSVLADVLRRFGERFPDVEIRIDEAYSGVDRLVGGRRSRPRDRQQRTSQGRAFHASADRRGAFAAAARSGQA
jgi:DNA-binding transcriptional LysR family regulator